MAKKYDLSKAELLKRDDAAVQLALGESQIVNDIKDYLVNHGNGFISGLYPVYISESVFRQETPFKGQIEC